MLGLCFCARAFSSCGERGPLFIAVRGPPTIAASPVVEHRLQTRRLSSCGSRAQLLRGMWDLPRPGLEPVSHALAGGFSTTAPPGKPYAYYFTLCNFFFSNMKGNLSARVTEKSMADSTAVSRASDNHITTQLLSQSCLHSPLWWLHSQASIHPSSTWCFPPSPSFRMTS